MSGEGGLQEELPLFLVFPLPAPQAFTNYITDLFCSTRFGDGVGLVHKRMKFFASKTLGARSMVLELLGFILL